MGDALTIRAATPADVEAIARIYAAYVRDSAITFEVDAPSAEEMAARMAKVLPRYPYLIAEDAGRTVGYAYATALYDRAAYRWACEGTVYVERAAHGRGIGGGLYRALIDRLREQGFQTVFGKITLPNPASTGLHERLGFTSAGILARVGYKLGQWYDVGIYQLELGPRPAEPEETVPIR